MTVPVGDVLSSQDWYERAFEFRSVLVEEEEDRVLWVLLEHPCGVFVRLYATADRARALSDFCIVSFTVGDLQSLLEWSSRLDRLGIACSEPRPGRLGWSIEVTDPDGGIVQLHTSGGVVVDEPYP